MFRFLRGEESVDSYSSTAPFLMLRDSVLKALQLELEAVKLEILHKIESEIDKARWAITEEIRRDDERPYS
jgi:hypothetical protein